MRVKICGVTREEDARLACELGAWAVGLIFVPSSPRALDLERAKTLRRHIRPGTLAIGVFMDADASFVEHAAVECRLDAVQLHGAESPADCAAAGAPAYKALTLSSDVDLHIAERYAGRVAGLIIETNRRIAGLRENLDDAERLKRWKLAHQAARFAPVILAGELTAQNVALAIRAAMPVGVDVCGGVESAPGTKDPGKMRAFFDAVKGAAV